MFFKPCAWSYDSVCMVISVGRLLNVRNPPRLCTFWPSGARREFGPMRCQILDGQLFLWFACVLKYVRGAPGRLGAKSW